MIACYVTTLISGTAGSHEAEFQTFWCFQICRSLLRGFGMSLPTVSLVQSDSGVCMPQHSNKRRTARRLPGRIGLLFWSLADIVDEYSS